MEVDTAADYSIMSKSTYARKFSNFPLHPSKDALKTYTGETLTECGEMQCDIVYRGHKYTLPIAVANHDNKPTLLGRNWLIRIKIEWGEIFCLMRYESQSAKSRLDDLLAKVRSLKIAKRA